LATLSCKKPDERPCWKSHGEEVAVEIPLDSINTFRLGKRLKYRIFEDNQKKVVIKGGENMVGLVDLTYEGYELSISDKSKCHFLRDPERIVEVEIHYPEFNEMYFTASDSVIFEDTIHSKVLIIQMEEAGGSMVLNVDNIRTEIVASIGTANYVVSGHSNYGSIKVQDKGYADASNFTTDVLFGYQNSTSDLFLNLDGSEAEIIINGTGDVFYSGTADTLILSGAGSGNLIEN
jgi:hypothetical protein